MPARLNILISYPYLRKMTPEEIAVLGQWESTRQTRLLIDSGAFTAWKQGVEINVDDYCKFLEELPVKPWRYFVLDVIGDPEGTQKNYEIMLKRGFSPVPIFTRGEDLSTLDQFYDTSDVVGVGGLVGTKNNKGFVKGLMKHIGDRKVHWLGFTNLDFLSFYRPYMCDSSSWETGARYGTVRLYMGRGRFQLFNKFSPKPYSPTLIDRIRTYGLDPYFFYKPDAWTGGQSFIRRISATSAVALSIDLEEKFGVKFFNAATTFLAVRVLYKGFERMRLVLGS